MRHVSAIFAGIIVLASGLSLAPGLTGGLQASEGLALQATNPLPADAETIAKGRQIYMRFCRSCHGNEGKGDGAGAPDGVQVANLVDATWDNGSSDTEIFKTIKEGVPPNFYMEPWEGRITDEDIWSVIHYLRELEKKPGQ